MFGFFFGRPAAKTLHRTMAFDLVSSLHSDSLLFLAENDPRHSMAGVESRYFLRINGHPRLDCSGPFGRAGRFPSGHIGS